MADQLRWILAVLSALLLAGIWWWGMRRSRRSPGNAELREAAGGSGATSGNPAAAEDLATVSRLQEAARDWGVPPLEPLSIRTAEFESAQLDDLPMTAQSDPLESTVDLGAAQRDDTVRQFVRVPTLRMNDAVPVILPEAPPVFPPEHSGSMNAAAVPASRVAPVPTIAPAPVIAPASTIASSQTAGDPAPPPAVPEPLPQGPNSAEVQRVVGIRVCASGEARWTGADLLAALEQQGLTHGRYQVFHRLHGDGRTLFCAASLVEPGVFDIDRMPEEEFRGLTLFAVLPGPEEPVQTLESMIATAASLARTLQGVVQDAKGAPLSQRRAEALRDEVVRFQSRLILN